MAEYNLGALSYLEFEHLIRDLFQEEWSGHVESFKTGKDGGIDLRYFDNGSTIIQCKHYFESTYAKLKSDLINSEKKKVEKIRPDRYILVTSVELSPSRKTELREIFNPFCKNDSDIYGREDILNLLNLHEKIVKRHYKLWFTSTYILQEVLERIIHSDNYTKTKMDLQEFQKIFPKVVITDSFKKFGKILDEHNVCVICGSPGSGKTTMMKFFVLNYIQSGYQPIMVTENINEAYKMFNPEEPQIFYFDDFLGQTFLEDNFLKNEDSQILLFIDRNKTLKNKKFILSTREYVLNQAEIKSGKIKRVEEYKYILNCSDFSLEEKARILYNFLWHSEINTHNIEELIENKNYLKIIQHENFNPRLIETMTKAKNINRENFIDEFLRSLDNPTELWNDVFEYRISSHARTLLLIMGTSKFDVNYDSLWIVFKNYYGDDTYFDETKLLRNFKNGLNELDDTFLKSTKLGNSSTIYFDFHNPSIRDFIQNYLLNEKIFMNRLCDRAVYFSQIEQIWNIFQYGCQDRKIDREYVTQHIDLPVYLTAIDRFFNTDDASTPPFEHQLLHLIKVTSSIRDSNFIDCLNKKLGLLIQQNNNGLTTQIDSLYTIALFIKKRKELIPFDLSIDYGEWAKSVKHAILYRQPTYISEFKIITNYISYLGISLDPHEMDLLQYRLNLILEQGIDIDDKFAISTYNPDSDCFETIGFKIEGLEELEKDLEEISVVFGSIVEPIIDKINKEISEYYDALLDNFDDDRRDFDEKTDIQNSENEIGIDSMFTSLKNK